MYCIHFGFIQWEHVAKHSFGKIILSVIICLNFICQKEELSVTVVTIPPWCCVTDATLDLLRSQNFPGGLKIAPAHTHLLALPLLLYGG